MYSSRIVAVAITVVVQVVDWVVVGPVTIAGNRSGNGCCCRCDCWSSSDKVRTEQVHVVGRWRWVTSLCHVLALCFSMVLEAMELELRQVPVLLSLKLDVGCRLSRDKDMRWHDCVIQKRKRCRSNWFLKCMDDSSVRELLNLYESECERSIESYPFLPTTRTAMCGWMLRDDEFCEWGTVDWPKFGKPRRRKARSCTTETRKGLMFMWE